MRAYLINPFDTSITEVEYDGNYKNIYKHIDCDCFTTVRVNADDDTIFVDDNGLMRENQRFFQLKFYDQPLAGKGLVLGCDKAGESCEPSISLTELRKLITFLPAVEKAERVEPKPKYTGKKVYDHQISDSDILQHSLSVRKMDTTINYRNIIQLALEETRDFTMREITNRITQNMSDIEQDVRTVLVLNTCLTWLVNNPSSEATPNMLSAMALAVRKASVNMFCMVSAAASRVDLDLLDKLMPEAKTMKMNRTLPDMLAATKRWQDKQNELARSEDAQFS